MGRYMYLHFEFEGVSNPIGILEPLFFSQLFKPVAVGGIAPPMKHKRGDHWFLSGYGLEHFVNSIHRKPVHQPGTIKMIAEAGSEEHDYLLTVSKYIRQAIDLKDQLSPFEQFDAISGVTYLNSGQRIGSKVLEEMHQWIDIHSRGTFHLYGAMDIIIRHEYKPPWKQVFRFSHETQGKLPSRPTPLLTLEIQRSPIQFDRTLVAVSTDATIWLQGAQALNGLIGRQEADENLARFSSLAHVIFNSINVKPTVELHLEGLAFHNEADRIRLLLSSKLNYVLRP